DARVGESPGLPDKDAIVLRLRLIREELSELEKSIDGQDIVDVADALADLLYVTYGTAIAFGIDIRPVFKEVHRANMTKEGGKVRADGKILKPEGWKPPRIEDVLCRQGTIARGSRDEGTGS
ncbi:MAG: hypothetical protein R6U70_02880, partial [Bacillota bacterium]